MPRRQEPDRRCPFPGPDHQHPLPALGPVWTPIGKPCRDVTLAVCVCPHTRGPVFANLWISTCEPFSELLSVRSCSGAVPWRSVIRPRRRAQRRTLTRHRHHPLARRVALDAGDRRASESFRETERGGPPPSCHIAGRPDCRLAARTGGTSGAEMARSARRSRSSGGRGAATRGVSRWPGHGADRRGLAERGAGITGRR